MTTTHEPLSELEDAIDCAGAAREDDEQVVVSAGAIRHALDVIDQARQPSAPDEEALCDALHVLDPDHNPKFSYASKSWKRRVHALASVLSTPSPRADEARAFLAGSRFTQTGYGDDAEGAYRAYLHGNTPGDDDEFAADLAALLQVAPPTSTKEMP